MSIVGTVESVWRYPVKSMRGEELDEIFAGYAGVYGDRLYAFRSSASRKGFPYLTGREQRQMLCYRPRFRHPDKAARPVNLIEAENLPPGANPLSADPAELTIDVETPDGRAFAIDDPALIDLLCAGIGPEHQVTLMRSDRALTDCRPLSLFSIQSAQELGHQIGISIDKRRFRANIYLDLKTTNGFGEDAFVGRRVRIGSKVVLSALERDPRCMMITLDPDTAEKEPAVLKKVAQAHSGMAGIYGAILAEGMVKKGDTVELLD